MLGSLLIPVSKLYQPTQIKELHIYEVELDQKQIIETKRWKFHFDKYFSNFTLNFKIPF